jgi:two-component system sensor histidine kinase RegB
LISIIINIYSYLSLKNNNYLLDREAFYFLLFDTIQLGILLYLTGGIYNPFALLLIAPLIISSSYLPKIYSIYLLFLSISIALLITNIYLPINWNHTFSVPSLFKYGLTFSLVISLVFIFIYVYSFANSSREISKALSETKLALSNQKKLSEIGSLSAAAVHELSTPLNTIFLILNDLRYDNKIKNSLHIKNEIDLLKSQADRCKDILLTLSQNPENLKDDFLDKTYISNLIKINFDKFNNKNAKLEIILNSKNEEPQILYKDELIFALGNMIQNAIQHSRDTVIAEILWDEHEFIIIIKDNGAGFKNEILEQIGKPYISDNKQGMGLGIFIAKNLIENINGTIGFNNHDLGGGMVEIKIKRAS